MTSTPLLAVCLCLNLSVVSESLSVVTNFQSVSEFLFACVNISLPVSVCLSGRMSACVGKSSYMSAYVSLSGCLSARLPV